MKFRTEVPVPKSTIQMSYEDNSLFIGSCFSVNIHSKLHALKFNTDSNPFGIVYNPISLARQLNRIIQNQKYVASDLQFQNERWFSFDHHSDFSFTDKSACLEAINTNLNNAHSQLKNAKFLFITLGTSWVYELEETKQTVSNCHKLPAKNFNKYLAKTEDMVSQLSFAITEIKKVNSDIQIVFSISPVRHLADGFFENQVSKGRLFDVIHQLKTQDDSIQYFSAYEMVLDDLRDYRFYNSDLVHPSYEAISYIWEKFVETFISKESVSVLTKVEKVIQAAKHRPFNPKSEAHQKFIAKTLAQIKSLEGLVFDGFDKEVNELIY